MKFVQSLVSKKLLVTSAVIGLVQTLPMSADWKGICSSALAVAFIVAQAYVDSVTPAS
ncbi:MAG: hypothetical protein KGL39_18040 [Patescibacteria group bacterium]|nr:hypothetical protein [Patescibacteria group bacterium]